MTSGHRQPARALVTAACLALAACSATSAGTPPPPPPGPGVVFSAPFPGQLDVPVGTRVSVAFSQALATTTVAAGCTADGQAAAGSICVVGPDGSEVVGRAEVVGVQGSTIQLTPAEPLAPGLRYEVRVDPDLIAPRAGNVPADAALLSFVTRDDRLRPGPAALLAVNAEDPAVFAPGSTLAPRRPLVEFATLRLLMSEPLDPTSAAMGNGVELVAVDEATDTETQIAAALLIGGTHVVIDPDVDLAAGRLYRVRLGPPLRDLGGEAIAPTALELRPTPSRSAGELYRQVLAVAPGRGEPDYPAPSDHAAAAKNSAVLSSALLGDNTIELEPGQLEVYMAHPDDFTVTVPVVARKGQRLTAASLPIAFGGLIPTGVATGQVELRFLTDVTGTLERNPFWPADQVPDNDEAPIAVRLSFDIAMSAADPQAGGALTQSILGVEASGVGVARGGALELSTIGTIELDLLHMAVAPVATSLAFRSTLETAVATDTTPPVMTGAFPERGGTLLTRPDSVLLAFSEPVVPRGIRLEDTDGNPVAAAVRTDGSMVVISTRQLAYGGVYTVVIGDQVTDAAGNAYRPIASDPTGATGRVGFRLPTLGTSQPAPAVATAIYPGVACAVSGGSCVGGLGSDADYAPFELPADHHIEVAFDQPLAAATATLGTACDVGAVRVERLTALTCQEPVAGTLLVRERGLVFHPAQPWQVGTRYRLTLHPGGNASCGAGELCGENGLPIASDPLSGAGAGDAGGPDLTIDFVAVASTGEPMLAVAALPRVDHDGNGRIDGAEVAGTVNRAAAIVTGTSGIVSSASFSSDCDGDTPEVDGCLYLTSDLVATIGKARTDCEIETADGIDVVPSCVPFEVRPPIIYGSSVSMDASVLGLGLINDLATGKTILRVRDDLGPVIGYMIEGAGGKPEVVVVLHTYMDAPDLTLLGGLSSHDLHSFPLDVPLRGPIEILADGRLVLSLRNEIDVAIEVGVSALGVGVGGMTLTIPAGRMNVALTSPTPHGGEP